MSRRVQPVFYLREPEGHVGAAKKAIAALDGYEKQMRPAIDAMKQSMDGQGGGSANAETEIQKPCGEVGKGESADPRRRPFKASS